MWSLKNAFNVRFPLTTSFYYTSIRTLNIPHSPKKLGFFFSSPLFFFFLEYLFSFLFSCAEKKFRKLANPSIFHLQLAFLLLLTLIDSVRRRKLWEEESSRESQLVAASSPLLRRCVCLFYLPLRIAKLIPFFICNINFWDLLLGIRIVLFG